MNPTCAKSARDCDEMVLAQFSTSQLAELDQPQILLDEPEPHTKLGQQVRRLEQHGLYKMADAVTSGSPERLGISRSSDMGSVEMDTRWQPGPQWGQGGISHGPRTTGQRQAEPGGATIAGDLGWTQRMAAVELGISVRTVIRHEKGQHRTPRVPLPLLLKLRDVESVYAEEILVYLDRTGRRNPWLPSEQRKLHG